MINALRVLKKGDIIFSCEEPRSLYGGFGIWILPLKLIKSWICGYGRKKAF